jgi:hypothetical protein
MLLNFGSKSPLNKVDVFDPEPQERNTTIVKLTAGLRLIEADTKVFGNVGSL